MKFLIEKRNSIVEEINNLFKGAETEKRALTEDEQSTFEAKTAELKALDKTIEAKREARSLTMMDDETPKTPEAKVEERSIEEIEQRNFEAFLRENREATNMTKGANGVVIPTTIANRIIDTVKQIAPIYALTTKFNVKGKLQFPVASGSITTGYQEEFTDIASSAVTFTNVELDGYLIGALSKVSVSLINNAQFDIVSYVVNKIAQSIAEFLEKELLVGNTKIKGITNTAYENAGVKKVETATKDVVTADDLIDTQAAIKMNVQTGCKWLMNQTMLTKVRKLKDNNGQYILNPDVRTGFGYELLGKQVMISDEMPDDTVVYGDWSAMYVNIHEDVNIRQLNEVYAAQHGVGFVAWAELDAKLVETDKFAKLVNKADAVAARSTRSTKAAE